MEGREARAAECPVGKAVSAVVAWGAVGPAVAVAVAVLAERAVVRPEVQYGGKSAAIEAGLPLLAILAQRPVKRRL